MLQRKPHHKPLRRSAKPMKRGQGLRAKSKTNSSRVENSTSPTRATWNSFLHLVNVQIFELLNIRECEIKLPGCKKWPLNVCHTRRRTRIPIFDYYYGLRCVLGDQDGCHQTVDSNSRSAEITLEKIIQLRFTRLGITEAIWVQLVLKAIKIVREQDAERDKPRFGQFEVMEADLRPDSFQRKRKI